MVISNNIIIFVPLLTNSFTMNPKYKELLKVAKQRRIKTVDDLTDLISEMYDECTGGEFECAKQILKIK